MARLGLIGDGFRSHQKPSQASRSRAAATLSSGQSRDLERMPLLVNLRARPQALGRRGQALGLPGRARPDTGPERA
jgi:hypothetical protein